MQEVSEEEETPMERPAKVTKDYYDAELRKCIRDGNRERFEQLLQELKENNETHYDLNKSSFIDKPTLLQYACQNGAAFAVDALIKADVDPNQTSKISSMPPLLEAASKGDIDILKLLTELEQVKLNAIDKTKLTALHKVTQKLIYSKSTEERSRYLECLRLLLSHASSKPSRPIDINAQDIFGNTPLHFAALSGVEDAILELLRRGAHLGIKNVLNETAVKRINASTLECYMDSCISLQEDPDTTKEFSIKFDYSVLAPPRQIIPGESESGSNEANQEEQIDCTKLCIAPENNRINEGKVNPECEALWHLSTSKKHQFLLKHPLITSFLELKWQNIRTFYYINLGIYSLSVLVLTAFILLLHSGYDVDTISNWLSFLWYLSFICVVVLYAREVFQLGIAPCCYVFNLENYTELAMLISTTLVLINWREAASWRHFSAVAILLAWVEELLLLGRLPRFAIFVTTFKTVFISFLLLLFWYSTLFIGFGLSFFLVFGGGSPPAENSENIKAAKNEESAFASVQDSLLKVLPMMIGEFDFGSLPFDPNPFTSRMIFVAFLFLITIVLLNLLNGLAVSDTQEVQSKAEILCYVSRVELISYIESILLGDPFEFLANWPPFSFLRRNCLIYSPILTLIRWAFINGFIPAKRAMLFYDCLPNKCLTVFPSRKINQISSSTSKQRSMCSCHDRFSLREHIIDSAIQRSRISEKAVNYKDLLAKMDELQNSILHILKDKCNDLA